ncbi:MAG: hypothetical protein RMY33_036620, partial [Nostoc sp. DedQUE03]
MQQIKQADLEMLELSAAAGEIDLKYMDESGFCAWSEPNTFWVLGERGKGKVLIHLSPLPFNLFPDQ